MRRSIRRPTDRRPLPEARFCMRIVCPHCAASYDVPDTLLVGRTAVRCARCAGEWPLDASPVAPPVAPPAAPPAAPPSDQPVLTRLEAAAPPLVVRQPPPRLAPGSVIMEAPVVERRTMPSGALAIDRLMAAPKPRPRASMALRLAWLGSLVLVILLIGAAYAWRAEVMAAWPPSVRLYAALGLAEP